MSEYILVAIMGFIGACVGACVGSFYSWKIANLDRTTKFKLAALDKRLEAHQEAYSLWLKLYRSIRDENAKQVSNDCENWWKENCLYLDSNLRNSFFWAFRKVPLVGNKMYELSREEEEEIIEKTEEVGKKIEKGVGLPSVNYFNKDRQHKNQERILELEGEVQEQKQSFWQRLKLKWW